MFDSGKIALYCRVGINSLFLPFLVIGLLIILFNPRIDAYIKREIEHPTWRLLFKFIVIATVVFIADAILQDWRENNHPEKLC